MKSLKLKQNQGEKKKMLSKNGSNTYFVNPFLLVINV